VEGGLELDLVGARRLLGEIMMSQDIHFSLDPNRKSAGISSFVLAPGYLYLEIRFLLVSGKR
jgi:hypothetical protein